MSGHSKWHNIQQRKGKQDALRSNVFSKYAKAITVAARRGNDPATNFSLRLLIEKAKISGMPKDNIERAVKRGTGELNDGAQIEEITYEAYGPGGAAIIIKAVTDNKNRATADIKHLLSESGGSLGGTGGVSWMFEQCGLIIVHSPSAGPSRQGEAEAGEAGPQFAVHSKEEVELKMIEAGADDIWEEGGMVYFKIKLADFKKALDVVKELGLEPESSGIAWVAKDKVKVEGNNEERLKKLFAALEENEDVEDYWTNAE